MNNSSIGIKGTNGYDNIKYFIGKAAVYLILLVYPFVMKNKLFGLTATRYNFFTAVSFICFFCMLLNEIVHLISAYGGNLPAALKGKIKGNIPVIVAAALAFSAIAAYIVSPYRETAWGGQGSRYVGMIFILALVCMYLTISNCYIYSKKDIDICFIAANCINLLAVAHFMGIDTFGIFTQIAEQQRPLFITTFGNVDVYGVYALLIMAVSMYSFMRSNEKKSKIYYGATAFIASMGAVITGSDAVLAGVLVFFAITLYIMADSIQNLMRYLLAAILFISAGKYLWFMTLFEHKDQRMVIGVISGFVYNNAYFVLLLILVALYAVLYYLSSSKKLVFKPAYVKIARKVMIIGAGAAASIILLMFILVNLEVIKAPFGLNKYFLINYSWGSGRGFIWTNLLEGYCNFPLINKLFGLGEATVANVLGEYASVRYNLLNGQLVDSAHNILLQFLVTQGIVGFAAYLGMYVYLALRAIKLIKLSNDNKRSDSFYVFTALAVAVIACFVQGLFCIMEVIAFPITICVMAMFNSKCDGHNEK